MTAQRDPGRGPNRGNDEARCANCVVCKFDTELCPLNKNYSPDAYLKWEAAYLRRRGENTKDRE